MPKKGKATDARAQDKSDGRLQERIIQQDAEIAELKASLQKSVAPESVVHSPRRDVEDEDAEAQIHLVEHQKAAALAKATYENRVMALQLQSLMDRFNLLDVEELESENHILREDVMRLEQENMELSRQLMAKHVHARSDVARIQLAMELEYRERISGFHASLRQELAEAMDSKTKQLIADGGALQDTLLLFASHAHSLDDQYRSLSRQRQQAKVDEAVTQGLADLQATQLVQLRNKLERSYTAIAFLRNKLEEAVGQRTAAAAAAAGAQAASRARQQQQQHEGDADSAYDMSDGGADDVAAALRRSEARCNRIKLQRDRWKERSVVYEQACAQLQAQLSSILEVRKLQLPDGSKQDLEAIWNRTSAPSTRPSTASANRWHSRPSTAAPSPSGQRTPPSPTGQATTRTGPPSPSGQYNPPPPIGSGTPQPGSRTSPISPPTTSSLIHQVGGESSVRITQDEDNSPGRRVSAGAMNPPTLTLGASGLPVSRLYEPEANARITYSMPSRPQSAAPGLHSPRTMRPTSSRSPHSPALSALAACIVEKQGWMQAHDESPSALKQSTSSHYPSQSGSANEESSSSPRSLQQGNSSHSFTSSELQVRSQQSRDDALLSAGPRVRPASTSHARSASPYHTASSFHRPASAAPHLGKSVSALRNALHSADLMFSTSARPVASALHAAHRQTSGRL